MDTTKYQVLEVIIRNRQKNFETMQVELIKAFPEMTWEEICSFIYLLKQENYVAVANGDNTIVGMCLQPTALARLRDAKETAKSEKTKEIISRILQIARVLP